MISKEDFILLDEKLFGNKVEFPINEDLVIIHGYNGTGKTKTLEILKRYFEKQNENVIYFDIDRCLNITKEQAVGVITMYNLMSDNPLKKIDISLDDFRYFPKIGEYINNGHLQIINMITQIELANKQSIVLIDCPEINLHISLRKLFINIITSMNKVKKLIVVTHSPEIITYNLDNAIDIENCVKLY